MGLASYDDIQMHFFFSAESKGEKVFGVFSMAVRGTFGRIAYIGQNGQASVLPS